MDAHAGIFWIILTVFCEARNQSPIGQKNVAKVIINRADQKRWPLENVVLARKQFSCFNDGLPDALLKIPKEIPIIIKVTQNVIDAIDEWYEGDNLRGATHYYAFRGPNKIPAPSWAKSMTFIKDEGDHRFLREG